MRQAALPALVPPKRHQDRDSTCSTLRSPGPSIAPHCDTNGLQELFRRRARDIAAGRASASNCLLGLVRRPRVPGERRDQRCEVPYTRGRDCGSVRVLLRDHWALPRGTPERGNSALYQRCATRSRDGRGAFPQVEPHISRACSSVGRALARQARGQGFDSPQVHKEKWLLSSFPPRPPSGRFPEVVRGSARLHRLGAPQPTRAEVRLQWKASTSAGGPTARSPGSASGERQTASRSPGTSRRRVRLPRRRDPPAVHRRCRRPAQPGPRSPGSPTTR